MDAVARGRWASMAGLGPAAGRGATRADHRIRRAGTGDDRGAQQGRRRTLTAVVRRLGGRHASVVHPRVPRRGGADARGRSGPPTVGADGACRPGSGRCGGRCRRAECAGGRLGELSAVLGGGVPDRNLLAWWATARTPHPALRGFGSHSGGGVARVALLPDQHGRSTWRSRAEQLPSDRGTARVRRGANRAPGRRGARRDAVAAAITMAAAAGGGEQERDGDLPVADGARRRRRTGRLSDGPAPPARAGKRGVVAVSGGVAGDPGFGVGGGTGAAVVGAGGLQSGVAHRSSLRCPRGVRQRC